MSDAIVDAMGVVQHFSHFTQDTRLLRLTTSLGPDRLLVERIDGEEGLSTGFCFAIVALSADARIDLGALLGQPALLQILTQHSRTALRPVHGHITACERMSDDGGFTRYRMTLEPWLALLRHRRDSYIWQDKSVPDIVQEIFGDYIGKGKLAPAWRLALADPGQYRPRAICTQYEESDLAFVERLLAEEGLFYWFEHQGDSASASFGSHTLVIADHNGAFAPNQQSRIRFHRAAAVERSDSITAWHAERRLGTNAVALGSWNEAEAAVIGAELHSAHDNGEVPLLVCSDHPRARRFRDRAEAERHARLRLEALEARNKRYAGESTVRTLAPGTTFVLTGHAIHDADRRLNGDQAATFAVVSVAHCGRNNLSSAARTLVEEVVADSRPAARHEPGKPVYSNRFTALRADVSWRATGEDGHGALLHPKPTATGIQTAIVVGAAGQDITTERDHRIKVQMHWQRGAQSQSRRTHPQGGDNASGNDTASIWIRVAEPAAGPNWGSSFIPRIGQEVIVDFIEGDIDRPIVIGSLYNGKGVPDAPGNQVVRGAGPALGNAPAWFAGTEGDHAHNAVLSGFKTQEIGHSQDGLGGYNALVFDDSTGQLGLRLQTTQHRTQLNLGHIKRQHDNERKQSHGLGAELTTEASGALRAGQGMLISADARPGADAAQMDAKEAHEQLKQAYALQKSLADRAQKHRAHAGASYDEYRHALPETALTQAIDSLANIAQGAGTAEGGGGGGGAVPAFGRPDMVISAPAGIAMLTPKDTHATANVGTITGGIDVSATIGHDLVMAAKAGISMFTYGDAKAQRKEQGDKGIKLHAAHGKVDIQAQSAELKAAADKDVHIHSTHEKVEVAAAEHVLLAAGGAYVKIAGGNIEIHAPGKVEFKAAVKDLSGPASMMPELPSLPASEPPVSFDKTLFSQQFDFSHLAMNQEPGFNSANKAYRVIKEDGSFIAGGTTSEEELTDRIFANAAGPIKVALETGEWHVEEYVEDDEDIQESGEHAG